jgi:hypothetical protein
VKSWGGSAETEKIVTADDDGRYTIERTAPGSNSIMVWARGFDPVSLAVPRDEIGTATLDVALRASRPIHGWVVGPTGRAVAGARVTACENAASEGAVSDAAGGFELPAVTVGCTVSAAHPRFSSSRPATIELGRFVVVRLATGGAIEGAVVDERGKPVNSFAVTIESFEPAEGESRELGRAGESHDELRGSFRFDDLAAGTYVLRAAMPEGIVTEPSTIVIARGKVARGVVLAFPKAVGEPASTSSESGEAVE